jgi:RHS repeat-associated protein
MRRPLTVCALVVSTCLMLGHSAWARGKIVLSHDEWPLSATGFSQAPDAAIFAQNIASWFTGGGTGRFLVFSSNFSLAASSPFCPILMGAGHTCTVDTSLPFDVPTLQGFDGIFLVGKVNEGIPDNTVLIQYVENGGHVYLAGGTGEFRDASEEAAAWNTFLHHFGLGFEGPVYNGVGGTLPIRSSHPVFVGVRSLFQDNGNDISTPDPARPCPVLVSSGSHGLYAACSGFPPDPATVAPPLNPSVVSDLATATEFLYTGTNPIQTGVAAGTIAARRVAVLRGRVMTRDGTPLPGVTVTIHSHPEFGRTLSRADGMFDLAANGGGPLTIDYAKSGFLPAQRQVQVPWQDYVWLPDVVMIQPDAAVTAIDLTAPAMQIARGNSVTDTDGIRQATLLFPAGTQAEMVFADGGTQPITALNVRATEYTVGSTSPQAMPAELPPTSAYTYAVELSADEALAASATQVRFSQPVPFYLENFLGFPVGMKVPLGYYDRAQGRWAGSPDGRVVAILAVNAGLAELDTIGDGQPDNGAALGITDAERAQLATLYRPGQTLWRAPIPHLTPWDCNWPFGPPPDAGPPAPPPPDPGDEPDDNPCERSGSIIECQNQILGERIGLVGTRFSLNYRGDRVQGRRAANRIVIPLSGASVPASLKRIELELGIVGRSFTQTFPAAPSQSHIFEWDGLDAYGRGLQGRQTLTIRIGYVYDAVYAAPDQFASSFSRFSGIPLSGNRARQEITIWLEQTRPIGGLRPFAPGQGLGGWSLSVHHIYDPAGQVLYLGDGNRRSVTGSSADIIVTAAGNGQGNLGGLGDGGPAVEAQVPNPLGIDVAADGSIYIASPGDHRVRRVSPDGVITTVAGTGQSGFNGDGIPATQARLSYPQDVALGPGGSLYIVDGTQVRRVGPDGIITTIAGTGSTEFSGDGGPATEAGLGSPFAVDVAADGSLYIVEFSERVRRVGPDGIITTIAGTGRAGFSGDGGPASAAQLSKPSGIDAAPDGSLYIADAFNNRIRRVGPDGIITTVAGSGGFGLGGDGGLAANAALGDPRDVVLGPDGSLYIAQACNHVIRRVGPDGIITTVAGDGIIPRGTCTNEFAGEGAPPTQAKLNSPYDLAFGPDGDLYIADSLNHRVRRITSALPRLSFGELLIAAEDGARLFRFDASGRHVDTRNTLTGAVLFQFGYDAAGRLLTVTDGDGNVTTIERDANGLATAIIGPFGHRTTLSLDANGYLASISNPAGEGTRFSYTADGLLTSFTDPKGGVRRYTYDALGRLTRAEDPAGGFVTLARTTTATGFQVAQTAALGRDTTFLVERLPTGGQRHVMVSPNGLQTETRIGADGARTVTYAEGTTTTYRPGPDPRWGMQAPLDTSQSIRTPRNLTYTSIVSRVATLTDPNNPLSLATLTDTLSVNGRTYTRVYDAATRTLTSTSPLGRQISTVLDNLARVRSFQIPSLVPRQLIYDNRGLLTTMTQGSGADVRSFTFGYDAQANASSITDPLLRTVALERDPAGRITKATLPDSRELSFSYDADGNLISFTPPGRAPHIFTYTPVGRVESYIAPDAGLGASITRYAYNADRSLDRVTRPDGTIVDYRYDVSGRLNSVALPRGQIRYTYDPTTGKLATVTAPDGGTLTLGYDGSIPTQSTWSGAVAGTIRRTYDNDLRLTSRTVNGAQPIAFQYDPDGLLRQAGDLTISRDATNGFITSTTLGNVADAWSYNGFGEPISYRATSDGTEVFAAQYTRDPLGRVTAKTETIGSMTSTHSYTYDPNGRLAVVTIDGVRTRDYTYDSNGNRLSVTGPGGAITASHDAQDRLTQYGASTYTYTANGELLTTTTSGQVTTYQHDALGNLMAVTLSDGTRIDYVVDGQNHRIGKTVNGALIQGFLIQGRATLIAELDGSSNVVSRFIYGARVSVPALMIRGGATYRIISDHLGSPRLVIDVATGAIAQRMDYDEFGNVTQDTNPGFQPFGFAGCIYDVHTKLAHCGARDYDAVSGRWTSKEPVGFAGGDPNLYVYARNDPVNLTDPNGLVAVPPLGGGITGAGAALTVIEGGAGGAAGASAAVIAGAVVGAAAVGVTIGLIINHFYGDAIQDGFDVIFGDPTKPDPRKHPQKDPRPAVFPPDPDEITRPNEPLTDPDKTWPQIDPSELPTDPNLPSPWDPREDEDPTKPITLPPKDPSKNPGKNPCP